MVIHDASALIALNPDEENVVEFVMAYRNFNIQNLGDSTVYVSLDPDIASRNSGITAILSKNSVNIPNRYLEGNTTIYVTGSGTIQVQCNDAESIAFFGGGSGNSTGGTSDYNSLNNLPKYNDVTIIGNKSPEDFKMVAIFEQVTESDVWTITHNLDSQYPLVECIGENGNIIVGDVSYISSTELSITFSEAVKGTAIIRY